MEPFELKELTLSDAIENVFQGAFDTIPVRMPNPLWNLLYFFTDKCYSFTNTERVNDENC